MKAPLPWFRMYSEAVDDAKLGLLDPADRWHFVALLCCKGQGLLDQGGPLLRRLVAKKLGVTVDELDRIAKALAEVDLIDAGTLQPRKWDDRQYQSDSSTQRVRDYRERMKAKGQKKASSDAPDDETLHETFQQRSANVTVTAQDTDTDTDADTETETEVNLSANAECATGNASSPASRLPACPHQSIIDAYARHLPTLTQPRTWEGNRQHLTRARWQWVLTSKKPDGSRRAQTAEEALAYFDTFFAHVAESDWLTGRSGKWTRCNLEWLMTAGNFAKVIDGNYHDEKATA